ncbi:MAG: glycosyltransferase family 39 protein, partial [Acidobacteria bacterium]|nr:glycosyltransferase family 39 protein [Acidobacteriota bacterium]
CVIGQGLLNGQQLYRDLWDNKPPGIFYLFAGIVKVFGPVMWCVGVVDILWLVVISYFIFRFAERFLGTAAAVITVAINATWHVWAGYWEAAQAETFLMLFVFISFFLVARAGPWVKLRLFAAGLFLGVAFWLKYNAIAFLPFVLILPFLDTSRLDEKPRRVSWTITWRDWFSKAGIFGAGFAATVVVVLGQFWLASSWEALKEVQFEVLPRYSAMALERTPYYPLWALTQTEFVLGAWTERATLAALLLAWKQRDLAKFGPVLLAAAIGYLSTASQVRFHAYGFETSYPFFAMVWGYLGVKIYQAFRAAARACEARDWRLARVLVWALFANLLAWPLRVEVISSVARYKALADWAREGESYYSTYPWTVPISHFPDQMRVINYLREHSSPQDKIFVWGSEPLIYFLTQRPFPSRFISNLALVSPWSPPAWRRELIRGLGKSPPRFLVVARDDEVPFIAYTEFDSEEYLEVYPELAIFIADHDEPAVDLENFVIYRREELSGSGGSVASEPSQSH